MADKKPNSPEPIANVASEGTWLALAVDHQHGVAYAGGSDGGVRSWDLATLPWKLDHQQPGDCYVSALAVVGTSTGDHQLVVARYDGSLSWQRLDCDQQVRCIDAHRGWIRDLALVGDGQRLVTVGDDMLVKVWEAETGQLLHTLSGHSPETPPGYVSALYAVAATPDGLVVASGDRAGEIRIWDVDQGREIGRLGCAEFYTFDPEKRDRSIGGIRRLRFSPDGRYLAAAGIGQISNVDGFVGPCRLEIWDWRSGKRVAVLQDSHQAVLNDVLWSADGRQLVAAGGGDGGGVIVVWALDGDKPRYKIKFKGHPHRLAWIKSDEQFLAAGFEGAQLWDMTKFD